MTSPRRLREGGFDLANKKSIANNPDVLQAVAINSANALRFERNARWKLAGDQIVHFYSCSFAERWQS